DRTEAVEHPEFGAVLPPETELRFGVLLRQPCLDLRSRSVQVLREHELQRTAPNDVAAGTAEHLHQAGIDVVDAELRVHGPDPLAGRVDNPAVAPLARLERGLGAFAFEELADLAAEPAQDFNHVRFRRPDRTAEPLNHAHEPAANLNRNGHGAVEPGSARRFGAPEAGRFGTVRQPDHAAA